MKNILLLLILFISTTGFVFAQCGYRPPQPQAEIRQKSSIILTEETKDFKKLATISKKEAKKIAVEKYPGKVKKIDLVKDEDTLVWKLEVKGEQGQKEVFVDPANGTFLGYGLTK